MSHGSEFVPRRFLMAQYANSDDLIEGTTEMRKKGQKKLDTYTPYPVHGIDEALGLGRPFIPKIVLTGAIIGICSAVLMMWYMNVYDWPINVAGRPEASIPAWVPITFELAVLLGGCSSFFGVIALMRLPELYHPVFQWETFVKNSVDGFFLSVELDTGVDVDAVMADVKATGPTATEIITEVER